MPPINVETYDRYQAIRERRRLYARLKRHLFIERLREALELAVRTNRIRERARIVDSVINAHSSDVVRAVLVTGTIRDAARSLGLSSKRVSDHCYRLLLRRDGTYNGRPWKDEPLAEVNTGTVQTADRANYLDRMRIFNEHLAKRAVERGLASERWL